MFQNKKEQLLKNIDSLLEQWQLKGYGHKSFHELSGGQKTRCLVIRALVSEPRLLFLDEPLANLDACCAKQLMDTLLDFTKSKKICVIIADHHLSEFSDSIRQYISFERHHDALLSHIQFSNV
jgi:ABC-type Mn2+/Zn2+ transport system ATPase subunit